MTAIAYQIPSHTIVYSTIYSGTDLFGRWSKTSRLRVTGLCEGNSPVTSEFPAQMFPLDDVIMQNIDLYVQALIG